MQDDLLERLRDAEMAHGGAAFRYGCVDCGLSANLCIEAAARIAALEADNARLMGLVKEAGEALEDACGHIIYLCEIEGDQNHDWRTEAARATLAKIKETTDA